MAFFNLDCLGGQAEAIIFHDAFDKYKEIIKDNNIVFLVGHTSTQNAFADLKLIVDSRTIGGLTDWLWKSFAVCFKNVLKDLDIKKIDNYLRQCYIPPIISIKL